MIPAVRTTLGVLELEVPLHDESCLNFVYSSEVKLIFYRAEVQKNLTELTVGMNLRKLGYKTNIETLAEQYIIAKQKYISEAFRLVDEYIRKFGTEYVNGVKGVIPEPDSC
jgi:hypothetical protein